MKIYLIGSLRNPLIPDIGNELRRTGNEVFDDWFGSGPHADDHWQEYETERGRSYAESLEGFAAHNIYNFDLKHMCLADIAVLALPAGKSGHLEFGYMMGQGKPGFIYFSEGAPERWDVMYLFATGVCFTIEALLEKVKHV